MAQASRAKQATLFKPKPLTIEGVFKTLKSIAMISGNAVSRLSFLFISMSAD